MDKEKVLELIQLDVTGCILQQEKLILHSLMDNDENFPWTELARYQNLLSLLPSILLPESPSAKAKNNTLRKMSSLIFENETDTGDNKIAQKEKQLVFKSSEKFVLKGKVDWESLSGMDSSSSRTHNSNKVKSETQFKSREKEYLKSIHVKEDSFGKEFTKSPKDQTELKSKSNPSARKSLRKYILIFIILMALSTLIFIYLVSTNENQEVPEKINEPKQTSLVNDEKIEMDNLVESLNVDDVKNVERQGTQTEEQIQQEILPTAPPQLPAPIDAQLDEVVENNPMVNIETQNDSKVGDEKSLPPPKEINEIEEEPTYFVAVEEMPEPINGLKGIQEKIVYPEIAKKVGIEGKVFVRAFVDEIGKVTKVELVKGIGGGCDEAAMDAILKTSFKPGKQRGKPVKVEVIIPIVFKH